MRYFCLTLILFCSAAPLLPFPHADAALQTSISVEQISPTAAGSWTFLFADGSSKTSGERGVSTKASSFSITDFLPMTFSVIAPSGMAPKIKIYRNGALLRTESVPQFSFTPYPNEQYRFLVEYAYARLGSLGVTSEPSGAKFRMKGPARRILSGTTPFTFTNIPAGKYTLTFAATKECVQSAPRNAVVEPETRNTIHTELSCTVTTEEVVDTGRVSKRTLTEQAKARELKPRGQRK